MKKKLLIISVIAVALILLIVYYFPQSLLKTIAADKEIIIIQTTTEITDDGVPFFKAFTYEFELKTDEHSKLTEILGKYNYRRNLRSLFTTSGLENSKGNIGFQIFAGNGEETMVSLIGGKNGEIVIDNHIYTIGIAGESKQAAFMEELKTFLSTQTHTQESV